MPFKKLPNVTLDGPNYGGYIYSLDYKNNFDESPSQLTLQLISENGQYNPIPNLTPGKNIDATIRIGNNVFLSELFDWEISEAVGQRTLSLTFIDKSVRLDRIWVSLFKRNENRGGTSFSVYKDVSKDTTVPILKANNLQGGGTYYYFNFETVTTNVRIARKLRKDAFSNISNLDNGGEIVVGEEQYIENTCSVPNSLYNFNTLLGQCGNLVYMEPAAAAAINSNYYNSYTGTLRQVLQNWCADFGLTFYWSVTLNAVVIRDAKIPLNIPNENSFTQGSIVKKTFGQSKGGTFAQYGRAWYEKEGQEARRVELSSTKYFPVYYYPFSLSFVYYQGNIFNSEGNSISQGVDLRSESEFLTSAMMGYYYQPFRKYYLWYELGITQNGGGQGKGASPLGILNMQEITDSNSVNLLINAFGANSGPGSFIQQRAQQFSAENLQFYIGYYDPSIEENYLNYEVDIISNYIGKFYKGPSTNYSNNTACDKNFFYNYTTTETPGGEDYSYYQGRPTPFAQFVRSSSQLSKMDNAELGNINKGAQYNVYSRTGAFSHSQDEFLQDLGIYESEKNLIDEYLPAYLKIDGSILEIFKILLAQGKLPSGVTNENLNNLYFFMAVKKQALIDELGISVEYIGKQINRNEQIAQIETAQQDKSCQFASFCISESQEVEQKIRETLNQNVNDLNTQGTPQKPPVGLFVGGNRGYGVRVSFDGKQVESVSPADGNFQGYSEVTTQVQAVDTQDNDGNQPGKIKVIKVGNVGGAGGVAEIRVVENNYTTEEVDNTNIAQIKNKMNEYCGNQTVSYFGPRQFLNVTSTEFLTNYQLGENGLQSISTNINDSGAEITYEFASNPPKIPSPDALMARVENRKNRNSPR